MENSEHGTADNDAPPCWPQNAHVIEHRSVSHKIKNKIVALLTLGLGEIFPCVIDDMIRANQSHHVQFTRAVYARDVGAEHFGQLYGERTATPARTINQNLLSRLNLPFIAKPL